MTTKTNKLACNDCGAVTDADHGDDLVLCYECARQRTQDHRDAARGLTADPKTEEAIERGEAIDWCA